MSSEKTQRWHGGWRRTASGINYFQQAAKIVRTPITPTRLVPFTTVAGLNAAIAGMAGGDYIFYNGTGILDNTSGGGSIDFLQGKHPASMVWIDLGVYPSPNRVRFSYTGVAQLVACYCFDDSNISVSGGEFTCPNGGGSGILIFGPLNNFEWLDFYCHDVGADGIDLFTKDHSLAVAQAITNCKFRGEATRWGQNLAWDPHPEPGTGLHAGQLCDTNPSGAFTGNQVAIYGHDCPIGAAIQWGNPNASDLSGNTVYGLGVNLSKVATSQVAANTLQLWGAGDYGNSVCGYLEGDNLQGRIVDMQGIAAGSRVGLTDLMVVQHGRHSNTNQNPNLGATEPGVAPGQPYDDRGAITYQDCL